MELMECETESDKQTSYAQHMIPFTVARLQQTGCGKQALR
jgi:hypothetical protein